MVDQPPDSVASAQPVADGTRESVSDGRRRIWPAAIAVYAASRLYSSCLLLGAYLLGHTGVLPFGSARGSSGFLAFLSAWDATYYRRIALHGYPSALPHLSAGGIAPNPWAFLPIFPATERAVSVVTGLSVDASGIVASTIFGGGATVLLAMLLEPRIGRVPALWAAAFFCFGPVAFVLQLPYAESLFCLLVFGCLGLMMSRRWLALIPLGVLAAFTRPGELALPLAVGILLVVRHARRSPFAPGERRRMIVAGAVLAAAGLAWPLIAGAVTGNPNAYVATELSWWTGYVGTPRFIPFAPWFMFAGRWLGIAGVVLVVVVVAAIVWALTRPAMRSLGSEVRWFSASYLLYLFCVLLPQQSLIRALLPIAPIAGIPALTASRWRRRFALAACVVLQPVGVLLLWLLGYP